MARMLSRLPIDPYILAIVGMVGLASVLPAHGEGTVAANYGTDAAIALLFFLHGARLQPKVALAGASNWRLHALVFASTFGLFPALGLAARAIAPGLLPTPLWTGVLLLCVLPSTVQSSIAFTSIARGNVAAAICSASASNLLGILLTPLLTGLLMRTQGGFSLHAVGDVVLQLLVPFVAGHYCSSSSIPASEAYADGNTLQITPASTNPLFTERKLWNVARVCGRDDQQGLVAADYIAKFYKGKNVAILNDKTTYGKGLADETKKALNKAGFQEKMFESYNKGDKDFTAIVSRMKRENIDLVYVGGYHQESGLIVRQMRDQGMQTVLMAGDALADKEFASITGPAGEGTLFTFGPDPRNKPTAKKIVDAFKAKNIDPEGYTLYTYAAMQVWSQAAKKAGTTDAKKVMATIKAGKWDTVIGPIEYDAKGDIKQLDYVVYKWDAKGGYAEIGAKGS